jgi:6-phosphogluconolactonase (cycloisomerase 2 family)
LSGFAYAGCYTPNGGGIRIFRVDPATGALTPHGLMGDIRDPSRLLIDRRRRTLYATSEVTPGGTVAAYRIGPDGGLAPLGSVASEGGKPVHLSLHPAGRHLFVANYDGGSIAVLPIADDGSLGAATDVQAPTGPIGPARPADAPPGSFADSGHDARHAHFVESDPGGRFVLHTDLGQDRLYIWRFDAAAGRLMPAPTPVVAAGPGSGPRHLCWQPDGCRFYVLTEESSSVTAYGFADGAVTCEATVSALPRGFAGTSYGSDLVLSRDGRFLYAANRLHDSIVCLTAVDLDLVGHTPTEGSYPRTLAIDPAGRFLYAMNQRSDAITIFELDARTGRPRFTAQYVPTGSPAHLVFLE